MNVKFWPKCRISFVNVFETNHQSDTKTTEHLIYTLIKLLVEKSMSWPGLKNFFSWNENCHQKSTV